MVLVLEKCLFCSALLCPHQFMSCKCWLGATMFVSLVLSPPDSGFITSISTYLSISTCFSETHVHKCAYYSNQFASKHCGTADDPVLLWGAVGCLSSAEAWQSPPRLARTARGHPIEMLAVPAARKQSRHFNFSLLWLSLPLYKTPRWSLGSCFPLYWDSTCAIQTCSLKLNFLWTRVLNLSEFLHLNLDKKIEFLFLFTFF